MSEAELLVVLQLQRLVVPAEGVVVLAERSVSRLQLLQLPLALTGPAHGASTVTTVLSVLR